MGSARLAILSVSNKDGIADFARELLNFDFRILASEGTAKVLRQADVKVETISAYTGVSEMLGGRVKTLHPKVFAGILAATGSDPELREAGILPVEVVVVNLYPFEETVARADASHDEAVDNIDVGGVSLIRAAAKNAGRVTVVVRPERYPEVLSELRSGGVTAATRANLAIEAFEYTSRYDAAIFEYLWRRKASDIPPALRVAYPKAADLRYGENPYQKAALYRDPTFRGTSVVGSRRLHGGDLSYNNIVDLEAALRLVLEFEDAAAAVIKHTNPSGAAEGPRLEEAYRAAHDADPKAAYGSVVGLNRRVDRSTAKAMKPHFVEAVIAPSYDDDALELLRTKRKIRILAAGEPFRATPDWEMVRVMGGVLVQTTNLPEWNPSAWKVVTKSKPTQEQIRDMVFAARVSRYAKSNSIVLASQRRTVGIGAGQMSRVDAVFLACHKAGGAARGSVLCSDAFFPFRDGLEEAGKAGVAAILQPGGSIRDQEVIDAANEYGIAMAFSGVRLFRH